MTLTGQLQEITFLMADLKAKESKAGNVNG
jgi:hypothetical protein